jgi:xylulokinase
MDPEQIWSAIKEVITKSVSQSSGDKVKALCASVLGGAVTPIDKKGNPLYNSLPVVDGRSTKQSQMLEEKIGKEQIFNETGSVASPAWSINKIMWLRDLQEYMEICIIRRSFDAETGPGTDHKPFTCRIDNGL